MNEPAFPRDHAHDGHNGMSLRDYFAAKELTRVHPDQLQVCDVPEAYDRLAEHCYRMADAMLRRRAHGVTGTVKPGDCIHCGKELCNDLGWCNSFKAASNVPELADCATRCKCPSLKRCARRAAGLGAYGFIRWVSPAAGVTPAMQEAGVRAALDDKPDDAWEDRVTRIYIAMRNAGVAPSDGGQHG